MIGQKKLLNTFDILYCSGNFPKFSVIIGEDGMGKKTLMKEISNKWKFVYTVPDVKVDTLRKMMNFARNASDVYLFIIPDGHMMSTQAKNSILKIVEEPPKRAYFMMSINSEYSLLGTLRSRASVFRMEQYVKEDLLEAIGSNRDAVDCDFILRTCENISDVNYALDNDLGAIHKHCDVLLEKAHRISLGNLLKSKTLMKFKEGDKGIDVRFLLRTIVGECLYRIYSDKGDDKKWRDIIILITDELDKLSVKSSNNQMIYEESILGIREIGERYDH